MKYISNLSGTSVCKNRHTFIIFNGQKSKVEKAVANTIFYQYKRLIFHLFTTYTIKIFFSKFNNIILILVIQHLFQGNPLRLRCDSYTREKKFFSTKRQICERLFFLLILLHMGKQHLVTAILAKTITLKNKGRSIFLRDENAHQYLYLTYLMKSKPVTTLSNKVRQ